MGHFILPRRARPTVGARGFFAAVGTYVDAREKAHTTTSNRFIDTLTISSVDTTNHYVMCSRSGDSGANNGYKYRYPSWLTPTVGMSAVVINAPTGPFVLNVFA